MIMIVVTIIATIIIAVTVITVVRTRGGRGGSTQGGSQSPRDAKTRAPSVFRIPGRVTWIPFGDHPLELERYRED